MLYLTVFLCLSSFSDSQPQEVQGVCSKCILVCAVKYFLDDFYQPWTFWVSRNATGRPACYSHLFLPPGKTKFSGRYCFRQRLFFCPCVRIFSGSFFTRKEKCQWNDTLTHESIYNVLDQVRILWPSVNSSGGHLEKSLFHLCGPCSLKNGWNCFVFGMDLP